MPTIHMIACVTNFQCVHLASRTSAFFYIREMEEFQTMAEDSWIEEDEYKIDRDKFGDG